MRARCCSRVAGALLVVASAGSAHAVDWSGDVTLSGPGGDEVNLLGTTSVTITSPTLILQESISNVSGLADITLTINPLNATLASGSTSLATLSGQILRVKGNGNFQTGVLSDNGFNNLQLIKDGGAGELILDGPNLDEDALSGVTLRVVDGVMSIVGSGGTLSPITGLESAISLDGANARLRFGSNAGQGTTFTANLLVTQSATLEHTVAGTDTVIGGITVSPGKVLTTNVTAGALTISGGISGPSLTKTGAGQLKFTESSLLSGAVSITGGRLEFAGPVTLSALPAIGPAGTLALTSPTGNVVPAGPIALSSGTLELVQGAIANTLNVNGGTVGLVGAGAFTNTVNVSGTSGIAVNSASAQTFGALTVAAGTNLTVGVTGANFTLPTAAANIGSLTKTGTGILDVTTAVSSAGTTTVSGGTLRVGEGGVLPSGAITTNGILEYNRSGTLAIASAISGSGAVTNAGPGTLNLNGTQGYHTLNAKAGVTNLNSSLTDATAIINLTGAGQLNSSASQKIASLNLGGPGFGPEGDAAFVSESLTQAAVPEPATVGLLGLGALGLLGRRRRVR